MVRRTSEKVESERVETKTKLAPLVVPPDSLSPSASHPSPLATRPLPSSRRLPLGRWLLIGVVVGWFAILILVPALALVRVALAGGVGSFVEALAAPDAQRAFGLTMAITLMATLVNTVFGLAFAIVLVRHKFWGKTLVDGLVDLPFAVSPIVAGLMLVILFGPQGWLGRPLDAWGSGSSTPGPACSWRRSS